MDFTIIRKVLRDFLRRDRNSFPPCDVLTVACDNARYVLVQGKFYAPLINTIEDALAKRGLTTTSITRIASTIKGDVSHGRVYSPEGRFARAMVSKRLKGLLQRGRYPFSHAEKRTWEDILDQTGARAVIGLNPSRELCSVCHERGIWVADIQHGVIAEKHPWYGAEFRGDDPREWVPDAFLVWDQGTAEVIEQWAGAKDVAVEVVGNPWVARFRRPAPGDAVVQELSRRYPAPQSERPNVLLSLTWNSYGVPNGHIHPVMERFVLETLDRYNWFFRLHPNQLRGFATHEGRDFLKYFERTFPADKVEWKTASEMPLPLLLSRIDLHVTWVSSVCMEAAYFGIPSLLTDPELMPGQPRQDYYQHLTAAGYATKTRPEYNAINDWFQANRDRKLPFYQDHGDSARKIAEKVAQHAR